MGRKQSDAELPAEVKPLKPALRQAREDTGILQEAPEEASRQPLGLLQDISIGAERPRPLIAALAQAHAVRSYL